MSSLLVPCSWHDTICRHFKCTLRDKDELTSSCRKYEPFEQLCVGQVLELTSKISENTRHRSSCIVQSLSEAIIDYVHDCVLP